VAYDRVQRQAEGIASTSKVAAASVIIIIVIDIVIVININININTTRYRRITLIDKRGFLPTFSLVNVRNFFRWAHIAFMAADGDSFPVPSSSPQHTHTDPSWQSTKTGYYRTHTPSRPEMLPAVSIDRAATDNITLGRNRQYHRLGPRSGAVFDSAFPG